MYEETFKDGGTRKHPVKNFKLLKPFVRRKIHIIYQIYLKNNAH